MDLDKNNSTSQPLSGVRIIAAMFLLGAFATLAQVIFLREMLVVFFGNELVIGTILAGWFIGISLGAFTARLVVHRWFAGLKIERLLSIVLLVMAILLPFQIYAVRIIREILHIPVGEYASLWNILSSSFLIFLPTCFCIGLIFPLATELVSHFDTHRETGAAASVSRIYAWESIGSMIGGVVLTYVLLPNCSPFRIVLVVVCIGSIASAILALQQHVFRTVPVLLAVCAALVIPVYPKLIDNIERLIIEQQWRAFGVLGTGQEQAGDTVTHLRLSENSIYQNITITESEGQFALYANGRVMFIFPDPIGYEHSIHFIMAQNPSAKRILLIGGNPIGDIPELLKYPVEQLVYVELDSAIGRFVGRIKPKEYETVCRDNRVKFVLQDAPRFVQSCMEKFDVVLVNAPEPVTAAANRFYTLEFYRNIRRILADNGFVYTALNSSERLQSESADLGASVYRTIKNVFPIVLVTAETQNRFFAGTPESALTFDRKTLYARSERAAISTKFFQSKYFLGADEIAPDKVRCVEEKFSSVNVHLNTNVKPVTYFYNLMLWNRFSGSGVEPFFEKVKKLNLHKILTDITIYGLLLFLIALFVRITRSPYGANDGFERRWTKLMAGILIAIIGFSGMALEIILIFIFQGLYGYIYSMMGLIVAVFMLGLVLGSVAGRYMAEKGCFIFWLSMALVEVLLVICALAIPGLSAIASVVSGSKMIMKLCEIVIYVSVGLIGWAVGAEFPLANRLYSEAGSSVRTAAAVTDAADHLGAAIGAMAVGVVLVPVLGIEDSCMVIAAVNCLGLLCLLSAFLSVPRHQV
ncbi:MAG: hypothetical protein PHR77_11300 [Kiritimatiellae bacterium]|nr:hypothetical protein [Kiritimatiellia bacterium]MDD5520263.1 hypothetical protein [Kiritimatiellia bacterium]